MTHLWTLLSAGTDNTNLGVVSNGHESGDTHMDVSAGEASET